MRKTFLALAAAFAALFAPVSSAQQPAREPARPALWKVADEDTTIYLFGTVHALPPNVAWYRGEVAIAFEGSKELVTEIVEGDPAEMQKLVFARALLPSGQSLRSLLSAEEKAKYEAALAGLGLPPQALDAYEPWYAAITLSTLPILKAGFAPQNGVEGLLGVRAKALGHEHAALETPDYQLGLFDALPADIQKRHLMEVVDKLPTITDDLAQIVLAWEKGDAAKLAELMHAQEDDPAIIEVLVINRNKAWANWIKERLASPGSVFVAVGAGHLAGPGSVQEQLAERGVASSRVQ